MKKSLSDRSTFCVRQIIQPLSSMKTFLVLVLFAAFFVSDARGQNNKPPGKMTFQGFLTDSSGNPLGQSSPTNYTVIFRLYKNATGTANTDKLWAEQQVVA